MSQPKNRRRAARKRARANREPRGWLHVSLTGEARNPIGKVSPLDCAICVGFGSATIFRDGEAFSDGDCERRKSLLTRAGIVTLRKVEKWIKRHRAGRSRWVASVNAPLWSATWERQRAGKWVCVEAGEGFA